MSDLSKVEMALATLIHSEVPRPSGTLSGHAAGLPFERVVDELLKKEFPNQCFRHYEALNAKLLRNQDFQTPFERRALFGSAAVQGLVARGADALKSWSPTSQFEEKQNDTAESILFPDGKLNFEGNGLTLIDVKTKNLTKDAQPPNIISADKLAKALRLALLDGKVSFDFTYVAVGWRETAINTLRCEKIRVVSLFKIKKPLYINWAAAQQIQFDPFDVDQDFDGNREQWAREYMKTFCASLKRRITKEQQRLEFFSSVIN